MMSRRCIGAAEVLDGALAASQPVRSSVAPSPAARLTATATMAAGLIMAATDNPGRGSGIVLPFFVGLGPGSGFGGPLPAPPLFALSPLLSFLRRPPPPLPRPRALS